MKFINAAKRTTGFALPLLSMRTADGPCGEFPDIAELARLAAFWKMDIVQLLPVNDTGWQTSPYSALSAFALNPVYLRVSDLPELKEAPLLGQRGGARDAVLAKARLLGLECCSAPKVPYTRVLEGKLAILEELWTLLRAGEEGERLLGEVEAWSARNPWVKAYACFIELKRRSGGKPWWEWPVYGKADDALVDSLWTGKGFEEGTRFRAWLQMRSAEQFAAACAKARGLGVDIMGDIPILMNADSADVWCRGELFDTERAAGAPPDMYSRLGQNWGFPLYRWDAIERRGYSFWKERLVCADAFYSMYRIDHVLGFFRIWAIGKHEADGFLGHFVPEYSLSYPDLDALGFDAGRIHWLSLPHVPRDAIEGAMRGLPAELQRELRSRLFAQVGNEALYLFSPEVEGGGDIAEIVRAASSAFPGERVMEAAVSSCLEALLFWWRNRAVLEIAPGQFIPTWEHRTTSAWKSLSESEKASLDALISRRKGESMQLWERTGRKILKVLVESVEMQACAEDLGAVPPCVPEVLGGLGIPGLRVWRWHRAWDRAGSPYVSLGDYPEASVACTSVHDSTNLRQWWGEEADRQVLWEMVGGPGKPPLVLDPDSAFVLLRAFAAASSRCVVYPLQDLLAASARHREANPADERINVPGTMGEGNWLYRMKPRVGELLADEAFASRMASLSASRL